MASESQVIVRFVTTQDGGQSSRPMQEAYEVVKEIGAESEWFPEDACLQVTSKQRQFIYVFEDFSGNAFNHIHSTGNRIYGPVCVLHCLKNGEPLPKLPDPIFSLAMRGLIVSCTNLLKDQRELVHQKVVFMNGEVTKDFHGNVSHLVAGEVGSKKYMVAANLKKKIMSPQWVDEVWNSSKNSFLRGDDVKFDEFRCPIFKGYVVTVSGMDSNERANIKDLVEREGGKYSGEMKVNECTHLIITVARGQKYEHAKRWKIHIVTPQWLLDSVEACHCMDETKYAVTSSGEARVAASTPTSRAGNPGSRLSSLSDVSAISVTRINETDVTSLGDPSNFSMSVANGDTSLLHRRASLAVSDNRIQVALGRLHDLDLRQISGDMFLDGCNIYLSGLRGAHLDKLRKIINIGGGTRLGQISESVTHVVVGDRVDEHTKQLEEAHLRPHVVTVEWVLECVRQGSLAEETPYSCVERPEADIASPQPKAPRRSTIADVSRPLIPAHPGVSGLNPGAAQEDMQDLLSQYVPQDTSSKASLGESTLMRAAEAGEAADDVTMDAADDVTVEAGNRQGDVTMEAAADADDPERTVDPDATRGDMTVDPDATRDAMTVDPQDIDDGDVTKEGGADHDTTVSEETPLFAGRRFVLLGFEQNDVAELAQLVAEGGGQVVRATARVVPDYAVVPVFGYPVEMTVNDVVTNAWLHMCLENDSLLDPTADPTFQPMDLDQGKEPLQGCVLSVSGYAGTERDVIIHIAMVLGATVQDYFVRNNNKKLKASTHLVVGAPDGSKYVAAMKWKLPAVNKFWLVDCATAGQRVPEDRYLVDNTDYVNGRPIGGAPTSTSLAEPRTPRERASVSDKNISMATASSVADKKAPVTNRFKEDTGAKETVTPGDKVPSAHLQKKEEARASASRTPRDIQPVTLAAVSGRTSVGGAAEGDAGPEPSSSGKENRLMETPKPPNNRIKELVHQGLRKTPAGQDALQSREARGVDSPSQFLAPGVQFQPNFELSDAMEYIDGIPSPATGRHGRKESLPFEVVFSKNLAIAVQSCDNQPSHQVATPCSQRTRLGNDYAPREEAGPLEGVVIAVSKKLSKRQSEYNNTASALGADYRWTYDSSCTHYIFQGRQNDPNKEFRMARDNGKIIVSPYWLTVCEEQKARVEESLFPHTYNPNFSLTITPARATRRPTRVQRGSKTDAAKDVPPPSPEDKDQPTTSTKVKQTRGGRTHSSASATHASEGNESEAPSKAAKSAKFDAMDTTQSDEEISKVCEDEEEQVKTDTLVNDLKTLMAITKSYNGGKRRSKRGDSFDQMMEDGSGIKRSRLSSRRNSKNDDDSDGTPQSRGSRKNGGRLRTSRSKAETQVEQSQMVEVTWDDPAAREQQQMLAHDLAKNSESFSPSDHDLGRPTEHKRKSSSTGEEEMHDAGDAQNDSMSEIIFKKKVPPRQSTEEHQRVTTPDAPPLAFPVPRSSRRSSPPRPLQPLDLDETKDNHSDNEEAGHQGEPRVPIFLLSGIGPQERDDYGALVHELGGVLSDSGHFDPGCTHLVVGNPTRNEKYLASVACGKWVLHKSYFEACRQSNAFVTEAGHEWGSDGTAALLAKLPAQTSKLARAAHRWRCKLQSGKQRADRDVAKAFDGWTVVLLTDHKKEEGFRRLLEAGGGKVVATKPPFSNLTEVTHVFIEPAKLKIQVDMEVFVSAGLRCLKPEYIAAFLMDDPSPDPEEYCVSTGAKSAEVAKKRKASGSLPPSTPGKKSKR